MKHRYFAGGIFCSLLSMLLLMVGTHPQLLWPNSRSCALPPLSSKQDAEAGLSAHGYVSPIDFNALHRSNPDTIAWMDIPNTVISYPILMRQGDDGFYLKHNSNGAYFIGGALFVESACNAPDFSDPVTVIYGHRTENESIFGALQSIYTDPVQYHSAQEIILYRECEELHYSVFAAAPFSDKHLLRCYDFTDSQTVRSFFQRHSLSFQLNEHDRILVLSTCLKENRHKRFLVFAKYSGSCSHFESRYMK